ncbi:hypothetical protein ACKKBF_B34600 [Auxenochlorella protothecoides x Auxenochlorella symbiontica]
MLRSAASPALHGRPAWEHGVRFAPMPGQMCHPRFSSSCSTPLHARDRSRHKVSSASSAVQPSLASEFVSSNGERPCAARDYATGEIVLEIPDSDAITRADAQSIQALEPLIESRSELVAIALWLMHQEASAVEMLARPGEGRASSPLLWSQERLDELLQGSPVRDMVVERKQALIAEWADISKLISEHDPAAFPPDKFSEAKFIEAMAATLRSVFYLQSAECFALLPQLRDWDRSGEKGAVVDYDSLSSSVIVRADTSIKRGQDLVLRDERPSCELMFALGGGTAGQDVDFLEVPASLVITDRLYGLKKEILDSVGLGVKQMFPIRHDSLSVQHLAYLRLSRIQDTAQFAKVNFERDVIISVENEYEILQLLMSDLRARVQGYSGGIEEDISILQRGDAAPEEKAAAKQRIAERKILLTNMDGVRQRLAPIRGIPTKAGMQDPNSDIKEIFDAMESIPALPSKLFNRLRDWATGKDDPTWKK